MLDGRIVSIDFQLQSQYTPTTTLLEYLRSLPGHQGVKEGCAEGDCGACTVVIGEALPDGRLSYRAVNSCLVFLPMLHRRHLVTIESVAPGGGELHPIQRAIVDWHGSQCGFCTPGIVMSLFALWVSERNPSHDEITEALSGNLCRCTGYRSIVAAAEAAFSSRTQNEHGEPFPGTGRLLCEIDPAPRSLRSAHCNYEQPLTLQQAITQLAHHPEAVIVQGGTDVALRVTKGHSRLNYILDLSRIPELRTITKAKGEIRFGSGMTLTDVKKACAAEFPALAKMFDTFGSRQIRNLATLGGNLATASPVGDALPALMAHDAHVYLEGPDGSRSLPVEKFITGYRTTARSPSEIITAIALRPPPANMLLGFYKVSRRRDVDIATVSAAFRIDKDETGTIAHAIVAFGGMDARPRRAPLLEVALTGRKWTRQTIENAATFLEKEFHPITDVRGSAEFRMVAARNLLRRFWYDRQNGGGEL